MPGIERSLAELYARVPLGMRLGLERMREACERAGHPERAFPAVHVAGTNGKGSVSAMVEASLRAEGKKTGLYTSPHLSRFAERIRVGGEPMNDDALEEVLGRALVVGTDLSFFETATLTAFLAFAEAKVDVAVLEVGIGGRLDATNVVPPPVAAAVTRIAFDHTSMLGDTLVAIAREKAGIAKPGVEIVTGPMPEEVRAAIDEVAARSGARTFAIEDDAAAMRFSGAASLALAGEHQRPNAAVAYRLARQAGAGERAIAEGLRTVRWPGRLEHLHPPGGDVLLDAAHNPDGASSLARYVAALGVPPEELVLVFGTLADKAWMEMIDLLAPLATRRVYVAPQGRAATEPARIAERHAGRVAGSVEEALATAFAAHAKLVVICGSILSHRRSALAHPRLGERPAGRPLAPGSVDPPARVATSERQRGRRSVSA